jgi:ribosome-interacting GTPase 1
LPITPNFSDNHPANFLMMSLSSMEDPGLVILPAHRILSHVGKEALDAFDKKIEEYFEITAFDFTHREMDITLDQFIEALHSNNERNCIGVYMKNSQAFTLLTLKPEVMEKLFSNEIPNHCAIWMSLYLLGSYLWIYLDLIRIDWTMKN